MKCIAAIVAGLLATASASATPKFGKWISVRGGGNVQDDARDFGNRAQRRGEQGVNKVKRRSEELRPEQIVPLTVGVVAIAQGLDMLINPQRSGRFFDNSYVITDTDKTNVSMIGARELIKGLAIAGIAINSDGDSLRLANAITLGSTVIEEGVDQLTARADGFRGVSGAYRNLNSAFRVLVSCATLWTMWSLKGKPTPDDY
ncbi:hypothetical protein JKP88DRAFT_61456 [Tribonema minus]|uniref:Uncharacterized protein n=1 Tax=Tribonema minus TaxID=303371 RepID=A0A835YXE3_9STRA|nr:hypothetical protein JKP88DRAFT_61456 [Tribonema minus]